MKHLTQHSFMDRPTGIAKGIRTIFSSILLAAAGAVPAHAFLIDNGSFEESVRPTPSTKEFGNNVSNSSTNQVTDWTIDLPQFSRVTYVADDSGDNFGQLASNGTDYLIFNGGNTLPVASISQSFATSIGVEYDVSFDVGYYDFSSTNSGTIGLRAMVDNTAGTFEDTTFDVASPATRGVNSGYTSVAFSFTASSTTTTLSFIDITSGNGTGNTAGGGADLYFDNVVVVPETSSFAFLAGCFGVALVMLRRRR